MKHLSTFVIVGLLCTAAPAAAVDADDIKIQWLPVEDPVLNCNTQSWKACYKVRNGVQATAEPSLSGAIDSNGEPYVRSFYKFDGVDDYVFISNPDKLNTSDMDDGLTVRAWFRPDDVSDPDKRQVVISNTNSAGFSLHLDGARVSGEVNIAGAYYRVTSENDVRESEWNQATFVVDLDGDDMESSDIDGGENTAHLTLILNGEPTEEWFELSPVGTNPRIVNSTKDPLVGAEPNASGAPTDWFFKGDIEAVNVRNYPIEWDSVHLGANAWLTVPPAEDGGIKGGEPSYYDSQKLEADLTVDARFADPDSYDWDRVNIHSLVPFINDEYVVQGMASTCPARGAVGDCTDERLFLSLYWDAASNSLDHNPSLIVEIDPNEDSGGRILSCRALDGTLAYSHVAGLGYHNQMLYVGSTSAGVAYAERYDLWNQDGDSSCRPITAKGKDRIFDGGSLSIQDGFALVSDYGSDNDAEDACEDECKGPCEGDDECEAACEDECEEHPAKLGVYKIQKGGALAKPGTFALPSAWYCLPDLVEGAAFVDFAAQPGNLLEPVSSSYLVLSRLDGLIRISALGAHRTPKSSDPCTSEPLAFIARTPKGSQDLALSSGRVWFANESGSMPIQQGKPEYWPYLFPFVSYVDLQAPDFQ